MTIAAIFTGSLAAFLIAAAALAVGQWFGRAPIDGRCAPRSDAGCGAPGCCARPDDERRG